MKQSNKQTGNFDLLWNFNGNISGLVIQYGAGLETGIMVSVVGPPLVGTMTERYCFEIPLLLLFFHFPQINSIRTNKTGLLELNTFSISQCGKMKSFKSSRTAKPSTTCLTSLCLSLII